VHGLSDKPSYQQMIGNHTQRVWSDATGEALIEAFSISNMAHGVPLATTGSHCGGAAGAFFLDAGISSTHHIARFWHLRESLDEMPQTDAPESVERLSPEKPSPQSASSADAYVPENTLGEEWQARYPLDPSAVIAAAFKAAGLAVPENPKTRPEKTPRVAAGPIIAAAFKIAGLK
jgi:hypothetical protein